MSQTAMPKQQYGISPVEGFSPAIGYYLAGLEYSRSKTRDLLGDLTPAEIAKRIMPEIYSIGAITLHLCECEYYWFQSVVRERDLTDDEMKFAHMFDAMENDVDRGFDPAYLLGKLDATSRMTNEHLRTMDDSSLDRYFASDTATGTENSACARYFSEWPITKPIIAVKWR